MKEISQLPMISEKAQEKGWIELFRKRFPVRDERIEFEVTPLDVHIVKMQYHLIRDLAECRDRQPDREMFGYSFESKDPTLNVSTVDLNCSRSTAGKPDAPWKIEVVCRSRKGRTKRLKAFEGTEQALIQYLNTQQIFIAAKKLALSFQ